MMLGDRGPQGNLARVSRSWFDLHNAASADFDEKGRLK